MSRNSTDFEISQPCVSTTLNSARPWNGRRIFFACDQSNPHRYIFCRDPQTKLGFNFYPSRQITTVQSTFEETFARRLKPSRLRRSATSALCALLLVPTRCYAMPRISLTHPATRPHHGDKIRTQGDIGSLYPHNDICGTSS